MEFGYYPEALDFEIGEIKITTLPKLSQKMKSIEKSKLVEKDWLYSPNRLERGLFTGKTRKLPYRSRIFGLPKTHDLAHRKPTSDSHLNFLIQIFGFYAGMRMSNTEAGYLDATPIKRASLTDFYCSGKSLERAMLLADEFWYTHLKTPRLAETLLGSIHALFLSKNTLNLDFEEFIYLYIALDGCYRVRVLQKSNKQTKHVPHSERIPFLCSEFHIQVPKWAQKNASVHSDVAMFRNETFHEALFFGKPFGFQIFGGNDPKGREPHQTTLLQMKALLCRIIVALLCGRASEYVRTQIDTRGKFRLEL
jgi:hypothetical protein